MRLKMVFVAAALALAVFVPVASAEKPIKEPAPAPDMFTGQFCDDFMVQLNVLVTENFAITFANGREFIGGRLIVEAVNLETGTSVTVNVSGPVFIGSGGDPFILRGNSLLFAEAGDLAQVRLRHWLSLRAPSRFWRVCRATRCKVEAETSALNWRRAIDQRRCCGVESE